MSQYIRGLHCANPTSSMETLNRAKSVIWFLGDVHGRFDHVIRLVKLHRPKAVIFFGDLECSLPLDMILRPISGLTEVWFIHGNHDSDRPAYWHNLHRCGLGDRSLHSRVVEIAGHRIAGLGGTFEPQVWVPGSLDTGIQNYQDFLERLALKPQNGDIVANKMQNALSAIYPDDYFSLAMEEADILVCHRPLAAIPTATQQSMSSPWLWEPGWSCTGIIMTLSITGLNGQGWDLRLMG